MAGEGKKYGEYSNYKLTWVKTNRLLVHFSQSQENTANMSATYPTFLIYMVPLRVIQFCIPNAHIKPFDPFAIYMIVELFTWIST